MISLNIQMTIRKRGARRSPHTLSCAVSKLADYSSAFCSWHNSGEKLRNTFARFALPMVWDYCEVNPLADTTGGFMASVEWIAASTSTLTPVRPAPPHQSSHGSRRWSRHPVRSTSCALIPPTTTLFLLDLMDFFHVWLRRMLYGISPETDAVFAETLGPKWDREKNDGELVDQPSRFDSDAKMSRTTYEDGMFAPSGTAWKHSRMTGGSSWSSPNSNPRRGRRWYQH